MSAKLELQPHTSEVLQEESTEEYGHIPPICVSEVRSPVRTQSLPRKGGATFTKTVGTVPLQVLWADHRRARARVVSTTALLIAHSKASASDASTMAVWPANTVFETTAVTEMWVAAASGTAQVGVITELWAEGE